MPRLKPRFGKLWKEVTLLAWALGLALVLSLILFGCMVAGAYVVDNIR